MLSSLPGRLDIIVSNPPYINLTEMREYLDNIKYEPINALYAKKNGLFNFINIIHNAKKFLKKNGFLFLEHGYNQGACIRKILHKNKYVCMNVLYIVTNSMALCCSNEKLWFITHVPKCCKMTQKWTPKWTKHHPKASSSFQARRQGLRSNWIQYTTP